MPSKPTLLVLQLSPQLGVANIADFFSLHFEWWTVFFLNGELFFNAVMIQSQSVETKAQTVFLSHTSNYTYITLLTSNYHWIHKHKQGSFNNFFKCLVLLMTCTKCVYVLIGLWLHIIIYVYFYWLICWFT